jgi:hypothetical protein
LIHKIYFYFIVLTVFYVFFPQAVLSKENAELLEVTPSISEYAMNTVKPILDTYDENDLLSQLIKVSTILNNPERGINQNTISPMTYMIYDKLDKIKLGFLATWRLTPKQKHIVKTWHTTFMQKNPADVFFAPSADELIKTKAAFGCSHYARTFIAVVKALGLINNPKDMRYVIACKADDYNKALHKNDNEMTINGHQFVLVRINEEWIAINTSKSNWSLMPKNFSPDLLSHDENIPIQFKEYPDITFLLRKIGKDYNDGCEDSSLQSLMNIYRSGDAQDPSFRWNHFKMHD